jgi:hypothetical protein
MQYEIWRRVRKPFRYPTCRQCTWEVFDANEAGCLRCGKHHQCKTNAVDNTCPLIECDDRTRVCTITGYILSEVRHAKEEFLDGAATAACTHPQRSFASQREVEEDEVELMVSHFLIGEKARICREQENGKQTVRLSQHLLRQMKLFKLTHPRQTPNVCWLLGQAVAQEKYWRFIEPASKGLVRHAALEVARCIRAMRANGVKITSGTRTRDLVCGLLYMLKHGLAYHNRMILANIPEVDRCLPHENKIETYFGVSSKVICMTENEVKLVFRETFQG